MFVVFSGYLPMLALKEASINHTLGVHYINIQFDVYLHMKCGVIPPNHNVTTLDEVFIGSDLLKSVLHIAVILQLIEHRLEH